MLLFAIVLGLAAVSASLVRPPTAGRQGGAPEEPATERGRAPTARPGTGRPRRGSQEVRLDAGERARSQRLASGRPAVVTVAVERPGQVEIPELGLTAAAGPHTPARFDVLPDEPGRHEVTFAPAGGGSPRLVGALEVVER